MRSLRFPVWICGLVMMALGSGAAAAAAQKPAVFDDGYRRQYDKWKTDLEQERRESWLTLAGLFWLKPGENPFGSASDNALVFAGEAPARAGVLTLTGRDVKVKFAPGVKAKVSGAASADGTLEPDISGHPTVVEMGRLRLEAIQRGERTGIRLWDMDRAEAKTYRGAIFYPLNPAYRVVATWVPYDKPRMVRVPNVLGDVTEAEAPGEVQATVDGKDVRLVAVSGQPDKGFFLIFSDPTRKTETYPAGRFLETGPVKDGKVVLDFNYAYNPPCALTPYATCPLPPEQNKLQVAVPAGERYDRHQGHP